MVTTADYKTIIDDDLRNLIIDNDNDIQAAAELAAIAEMQSYLNNRFDVPNIFNKIGTDRNAILVVYLCDMVVYHIHARINPRNIPTLRQARYEQALRFLEWAANGKITPGLPLKTDTEGNETPTIKYGSNKKFNQNY